MSEGLKVGKANKFRRDREVTITEVCRDTGTLVLNSAGHKFTWKPEDHVPHVQDAFLDETLFERSVVVNIKTTFEQLGIYRLVAALVG